MILVSVFYDLFLSTCTTTTMIIINATQSVPRIFVYFLSADTDLRPPFTRPSLLVQPLNFLTSLLILRHSLFCFLEYCIVDAVIDSNYYYYYYIIIVLLLYYYYCIKFRVVHNLSNFMLIIIEMSIDICAQDTCVIN